jgi:thioesterase domain-containing protein/acyl carrier protein
MKWPKFLRTAYDTTPKFLEGLKEETRRTAQSTEDEAGGAFAAGALAALAPAERLVVVTEAVHGFAKDVVGSDELSLDAPLLESGMDSLSGVEFRNRLQKEFGGGIRIPNSAVFDYPTVASLAGFLDGQLGGGSGSEAVAEEASGSGAAPPAELLPNLLEKLNARTTGPSLFLVPGAGLQASGFEALATLLPVPAYGVSWPRGALPRDEWPSTLEALAALILREVRALQPTGPYLFAGHSFGCAVCVEMARLAEALGETVALVALLDPRNLPPVQVETGELAHPSLADTLALLSQAVADGSRYTEQLEELAPLDAAGQQAALRQRLGSAGLAALEHVQETSAWYASLLAGSGSTEARPRLLARKVLLRADQTWCEQDVAVPSEAADDRRTSAQKRAEKMVRAYQAAVFQHDEEVAQRAASWCGGEHVATRRVPGGHFGMLHEPQAVLSTALHLCQELLQAEAAQA